MNSQKTNDDLEALLVEALSDRDVRVSSFENDVRYRLAEAFEEARQRRGLSIRGLAKEMGTSISQVQRLLHKEVGGSLTLTTLVTAADVLELALAVHARPRSCQAGRVVPFGRSATWSRSDLDFRMVEHQTAQVGVAVREGACRGEWTAVSSLMADAL